MERGIKGQYWSVTVFSYSRTSYYIHDSDRVVLYVQNFRKYEARTMRLRWNPANPEESEFTINLRSLAQAP